MAETKKRTYHEETSLPSVIKPARQPASRGTPLGGSSEARRQGAPEGQPKQELIIRLIDYLKSM